MRGTMLKHAGISRRRTCGFKTSWLVTLFVMWVGCGKNEVGPQTEVLVVLESDLKSGTDIASVDLVVYDGEDTDDKLDETSLRMGDGQAQHSFPVSLSLAATVQGSARVLHVVAVGRGPAQERQGTGQVTVTAQARVRFRPGKRQLLLMRLVAKCHGQFCDGDGIAPSDESCEPESGRCRAVELQSLPVLGLADVGPEQGIDAATDPCLGGVYDALRGCVSADACEDEALHDCDTSPDACEELEPPDGMYRCACPEGYEGDGIGPDGCRRQDAGLPLDAGAADGGCDSSMASCGCAKEVCNDLDDDCDGDIDENTRNACGTCGAVPEERCNQLDDDCDGETDEGVTNVCGECGEVPTEACNNVDDDCDGEADEGVTNACGVCGPTPLEVCNGTDDDCDGEADEGVTNACGVCGQLPAETCNTVDDDCDGRMDESVQNACGMCGQVPTETCNSVDDDCDGVTDEGFTDACVACVPTGPETCNNVDDDCDARTDEGVQNACGACGTPPPETCNGQDDDCDGSTDEGVQNACGACGTPPLETCNSRDDDCDGSTDEGVQNACGACGATPQETCNGSDDDCDGSTDEGVTVLDTSDPCASLKEMTWQPTIDGNLECGLTLRSLTTTHWVVPKRVSGLTPPGFPATNAARFAVAWHAQGLYVYMEIDDPSVLPPVAGAEFFCGDSIDLYFDTDGNFKSSDGYYDDWPGSAQIVVRRPDGSGASDNRIEGFALSQPPPSGAGYQRLTANGSMSGTSQTLRVYGRDGGYVLEGLITPSDVGIDGGMITSNKLGYLLGVHVSDDGSYPEFVDTQCGVPMKGRRLGQSYQAVAPPTLRCPGGDPWCTTAAFCTPDLLSSN